MAELKEQTSQEAEIQESEADVGKVPVKWVRPFFGKVGRSLRRELMALRKLEENLRLQRVATQELAISCEQASKDGEAFFPSADKARQLREHRQRAMDRVREAADELRGILQETASQSVRLSTLCPWTEDLSAMRAKVDVGEAVVVRKRPQLRRKRR